MPPAALTPRIVTRADLERLTPAMGRQPHPIGILYALMLLAGLRISETLLIKWADLVYQGKPLCAINLRPEHCKRRQARVVPISPFLAAVITSVWPDPISAHGITHNDYVAAPKGNAAPLTARTFQRHLATISADAVGYSIHPHMLRHTFATELRQVADITVVQQVLGHKRLTTTARYMTPGLDEQSQAIAKMFRQDGKGT